MANKQYRTLKVVSILYGFVASETFDVFKTECRIWQDKKCHSKA